RSLAFSLYWFSLSRYGQPLDLHSFPTRRSSDLASMRPRPGGRGRRDSLSHSMATARALQCGHGPEAVEDLERADAEVRRGVASIDRKSTRLNSSHSQISYAVFCLKKKKTLCAIV